MYPGNFHRLVLIGTIYGDTFNTSLSIVPTGSLPGLAEPTETLVENVANAAGAWWANATGTGARPSSAYSLTSAKLNRIGPDGRYVDGVTHEWIYPAPIAGPYSSNPPAQLATVLSLRTAVERGAASKGRMFLPVCEGFLTVTAGTGLATAANALRVATAGAALVAAINAQYVAEGGDFLDGAVGVASDSGSGTFREVTRVSVGRVTDTMRSRRNKIQEVPEYSPV